VCRRQTNSEVYSQLNVIQEVFGCFGKAQEEAAVVFVLIFVELGDRPHIQKLVEESATVPPLRTISHRGEIPRVSVHT
jgi:hypothetical protein